MSRGFVCQNDQSQFRGFDGYNNPNLTNFARPANTSGMNYNDSCDMYERDDSRMVVSTRPVHNTYPPRMYHDENRRNEPRISLPNYNGNTNWNSFLIQFQLLADRFDWGRRRQAEKMILCLRDEAQSFVVQLPVHIRQDLDALCKELDKRFGDHTLPETYRRNLQHFQKSYSETYQKYAARIEETVRKAYPGISENLFDELCVEYMLNGIQDKDVAYDVLTKKPNSFEEAINLLKWHNSCKNDLKKRSCEDDEDSHHGDHVRRINQKRFVTEERLQQFGRELKDSITKSVTKSVTENIGNIIRQVVREEIKTAQNDGKQGGTLNRTVTCYACHEEGHISRNCPLKENKRSVFRLDMAENQGVEYLSCDNEEVAEDKSEN